MVRGRSDGLGSPRSFGRAAERASSAKAIPTTRGGAALRVRRERRRVRAAERVRAKAAGRGERARRAGSGGRRVTRAYREVRGFASGRTRARASRFVTTTGPGGGIVFVRAAETEVEVYRIATRSSAKLFAASRPRIARTTPRPTRRAWRPAARSRTLSSRAFRSSRRSRGAPSLARWSATRTALDASPTSIAERRATRMQPA
jgi:hypothetical protein